MVNYYHILGLSQTATQAEIKAAYRKLALRYHPDKNSGSSYAEERFKQINEAYRVLSNPRKKARHDWMLEYGSLTETQAQPAAEQQQQPHKEYTHPFNRRRPPFPGSIPRPRFDSRQNLVATAWAFGIFFILALMVVGVSLWNSHRLEQKQAEQNAKAQKVYLQAEQHYDEGNYLLSLQLLNRVMLNNTLAPKASQLKDHILLRMEEEGLRYYRQGDYVRAAQILQLLADQVQEYRPVAMAHLISSYEVMQDYEGAVRGYKSVIKAEPRTIEARNRLARIYAEHFKDFDTALQYYQQASKLVVDQYETEYGKAYPLVVNPAATPDSHYQLHCGMAQVYISQGMLKQADSALRWAVFLRPQEHFAYYLMGIKNRQANDMTAACLSWQEAQKRGSEQAAEFLAEYCR